MINMAESLRVQSLIARAALHSRASAGCNFGQTAGPRMQRPGRFLVCVSQAGMRLPVWYVGGGGAIPHMSSVVFSVI